MIERITINGIFGPVLFISFVIVILLQNVKKLTISIIGLQSILALFILYGVYINKIIFEKMFKYTDVIYTTKWFSIIKMFSIEEKKEYFVKVIKEKCLEKNILLPNNLQITKTMHASLKDLNIEEINGLIDKYINDLEKQLQTNIVNDSTLIMSNTALNYLDYAAAFIIICGLSYYGYFAIKNLIAKLQGIEDDNNFREVLETIEAIVPEQLKDTI